MKVIVNKKKKKNSWMVVIGQIRNKIARFKLGNGIYESSVCVH